MSYDYSGIITYILYVKGGGQHVRMVSEMNVCLDAYRTVADVSTGWKGPTCLCACVCV